MTEFGDERGPALGRDCISENDDAGATATMTEASIASMARLGSRERGLSQAVKLLPGERMGWWSSQKYDKRKRMTALVQGAVDDARTRILLDTGENVSVVLAALAKRLRLRDIPDHGRSLEVKGINPGVMATTRRVLVKITLGWERVYEFEVWIMDHNAGVGVALGTDFMIPAGVRLDLFHGTAKLPDEVMVPLVKSANASDKASYGTHEVAGPTEALRISGREWGEFRVSRRHPPRDTHTLWIRRTDTLVPTVVSFRRGKPHRVRLTNVTSRSAYCPAHLPLLVWTPHGELPREPGYVRLNAARYNEWQVLAYANAREKELYKKERELYEQWLATQPPAVERPAYVTPREILRRPSEASLEGDIQEWACAASDGSSSSDTDPEQLCVCALVGGEPDTVDADTTETATVGGLDDYAHELAFLSDLSEVSVTDLNYTGDNVLNQDLSQDEQQRLIDVLKAH
ncbi:unnamed protein product [Phytophthora lilii]|uniref:Unnamed protein product n=1 Tax=Phytophthora lilii TaxID=2077276 RepID=A0A9W6U5X0_9STRA|nr:unnamed protein product [Phytophthora lilii]